MFLAEKGFEVVGVDTSTEGKRKAQLLATERAVSVQYDLADINDYDLGAEQWDAIVSIFAHMPSSDIENLHQRVQKALKMEGLFLLEGYNAEQLALYTGGPKSEDMMFSTHTLQQQFLYQEILLNQNVKRRIQEGLYHVGESSVVQCIVRRKA